jgi:hypothetical protein
LNPFEHLNLSFDSSIDEVKKQYRKVISCSALQLIRVVVRFFSTGTSDGMRVRCSICFCVGHWTPTQLWHAWSHSINSFFSNFYRRWCVSVVFGVCVCSVFNMFQCWTPNTDTTLTHMNHDHIQLIHFFQNFYWCWYVSVVFGVCVGVS